jgi:hypothetical protein
MEQQHSPFQAALKPGLIIGLLALAFTYIAYFIDSTLLGSMWLGLLSLVISIVLIIYFGKQYRTEIGGFMSFGTAFNFSFAVMVVSGVVGLIGQILLYHVIDPSLPKVLADVAFDNSMKMMESFGQNPDSLPPATLDEIRNSTLSSFSIGGQIKGFGFVLIISAIIALILAAVLKKRDKSLDY